MKRTMTGVFLAGVLLAGSAAAQESGFYVGAALGQSKFDWTIDDDLDLKFDPSQVAWKVFGGYQFNRYVALEGGFLDMGDGRQDVSGVDVSVSATAFQGSVILSYPVNAFFSPYVRGSAMAYEVDAKATDGIDTFSASGNDKDFSYGIGMMFTNRVKQAQLRLDWEMADLDGVDVRFISFSAVYLFD